MYQMEFNDVTVPLSQCNSQELVFTPHVHELKNRNEQMVYQQIHSEFRKDNQCNSVRSCAVGILHVLKTDHDNLQELEGNIIVG